MKKRSISHKKTSSKATFDEIEYEISNKKRSGNREVPKIVKIARKQSTSTRKASSTPFFTGPSLDIDVESQETEEVIAALKQFAVLKTSGKVSQSAK